MTDDLEVVGQNRRARVVPAGALPQAASELLGEGYRVALVSGHDDGARARVVYVFTASGPDRRVELHVPVDKSVAEVPTLARLSFAAGRFEREFRDLFGIVPVDHPLPARMVRHFHWPRGWHPMLDDAGPAPEFAAVEGAFNFRSVEGPGVFEIPVGPVHAGMIEPGHFRFSVVGETVLNLKARLWFTHRGVEKLFQGRTPGQGVQLAERISGDTTVGHTLAYCLAVEDALGLRVPISTARLRAILLELERLYNHVTDLGALCNDAGYSILNSHAGQLKERLLRLNDRVTGSRLLRDAITVGAAEARELPTIDELTEIGRDVARLVELALDNSTVVDRFTGTARLTREQAQDLGVLGYVARASGVATDARWEHPFLPDPAAPVVQRRAEGDVLARFFARADEFTHSVELLSTLLTALPSGDAATLEPDVTTSNQAVRSGLGIVEGWRGTIVHRVELAADGTLARVKVVDPSFLNWPAVPASMAGVIVPDFPLTNKSFNLAYAGNDL